MATGGGTRAKTNVDVADSDGVDRTAAPTADARIEVDADSDAAAKTAVPIASVDDLEEKAAKADHAASATGADLPVVSAVPAASDLQVVRAAAASVVHAADLVTGDATASPTVVTMDASDSPPPIGPATPIAPDPPTVVAPLPRRKYHARPANHANL